MRVQLPGGAGFRLAGWRAGALSALAALTVVVLLLTLLGRLPGQGGTATASTTTTGSASQSPSASLSIGPDVAGPVLAPVGAAAPEPTRAGLAAALGALIRDKNLGQHVGGAVIDLGTGQLLYGHDANGPFAPASTSKLLTATAALETLGPDFRITTKVVAGAVRDQIVLVGGGDPTLSTSAPVGFVPAPASLSDLARATAAALRAAGTTTVSLAYDSTLFSGPRTAPTWPATYVSTGVVAPITALTVDEGRVGPIVEGIAPRVPDPPVAAARAFARRLVALGIKVTGPPTAVKAPPAPTTSPSPSSGSSAGTSTSTSTGTGTGTGTPSPVPLVAGTTLGLVRSPALSDLVGWMLAASDNDLAEAVAHLTALAAGEEPSFDGGVAAVTKTLTALRVPVQGIRIYDASGLTGSTQVPPAVLAQVLALAGSPARPRLRSLLTGLAVAGFTGSLGTRFEDPTTRRAAGVVRAKTGTLSVVSAIAGTVDDADGRVLAFVFLADEVTPGRTLDARLALDRLVTAVAGCGCR